MQSKHEALRASDHGKLNSSPVYHRFKIVSTVFASALQDVVRQFECIVNREEFTFQW